MPRHSPALFRSVHTSNMTERSPSSYEPPAHLISNSGLTSSELSSQFEALKASLRFATVAPELIFERALSNLLDATSRKSHHRNVWQPPQAQVRPAEQDVPVASQGNGSVPESELDLPARPVRFSFVRCSDHSFGVRAGLHRSGDGIYGAGCQWPDSGLGDGRGIQFGSYNTAEDGSLEPPLGSSITHMVGFPVPFVGERPIAIAWLTGVDVRGKTYSRVAVHVVSVYNTGFVLDIQTNAESTLQNAGVAWVAFKPTELDIVTHRFRVEAFGSCDRSLRQLLDLQDAEWVHVLLVVQEALFVGLVEMPVVIKAWVPERDNLPWSLDERQHGSGYCSLGLVAVARVARRGHSLGLGEPNKCEGEPSP